MINKCYKEIKELVDARFRLHEQCLAVLLKNENNKNIDDLSYYSKGDKDYIIGQDKLGYELQTIYTEDSISFTAIPGVMTEEGFKYKE